NITRHQSGESPAPASVTKKKWPLHRADLLQKKCQANRSNRSFVALQIGQIPGGCSRAQRYPQTLHRQIGWEKAGETAVPVIRNTGPFPLWERGGRRSGTGATFWLPWAIASFTYQAEEKAPNSSRSSSR